MKIMEIIEPGSTFLMWHGSRRWDGAPEIRAPRAGRAKAGPGLYLTTSYMTAYKYAKGGGATMLVQVDRNIALAETTEIPLATALDFVRNARMGHKPEIMADLRSNAERMKRDSVTGSVLINLMVNYETVSGNAGLALARFLREQGIDASLETQSSEDWLVIINPRVIRSLKKVPAREVSPDMRELPLVRSMLG